MTLVGGQFAGAFPVADTTGTLPEALPAGAAFEVGAPDCDESGAREGEAGESEAGDPDAGDAGVAVADGADVGAGVAGLQFTGRVFLRG